MAKTPSATVRLAFNAGEISPRLDQRVDLEKASLSAKRMENFTMHVHGGAKRRPGTKFVAAIGQTLITGVLLDEDGFPLLDELGEMLLEE